MQPTPSTRLVADTIARAVSMAVDAKLVLDVGSRDAHERALSHLDDAIHELGRAVRLVRGNLERFERAQP